MSGKPRRQETFWDRRSERYDRNVRKSDARYEETIERTVSLLTESDVVLDFGCASGEIALDIAPHVQRIHGIDLSVRMIELANRKRIDRQATNVRFDRLDAFDESLASAAFSAVVAFNVFHLVDDATRTLARLEELLAPGGLLISRTPCLGERGRFFRSLIAAALKVGWAPPIRSLKIPELESIVSGSGFEILESELLDKKFGIQWIVARRA